MGLVNISRWTAVVLGGLAAVFWMRAARAHDVYEQADRNSVAAMLAAAAALIQASLQTVEYLLGHAI